MSNEIVKPPAEFDNSLVLVLNNINTEMRVEFDGSYLKQEKVAFAHIKVANIYIVYEINLWSYIQYADFT